MWLKRIVPLCLCVYTSLAIYVPNQDADNKTLSSLGIKTLGWQGSQSSITVHQNYSKVHHTNHPNGTAYTQIYNEANQTQNRQPKNYDEQERSSSSYFVNQYQNYDQSTQIIEDQTESTERYSQRYDQQTQNFDQQSQSFDQTFDQNTQDFGQGAQDFDHKPSSSDQSVQYALPNGRRHNINNQLGDFGQQKNYNHQYSQSKPKQLYFDNTQENKWKIQVYKTCPKGETGQFVYEYSCSQFLDCWKGRGHVQNCAPGTLFNPKSLECDYPEKVTCVTGVTQGIMEDKKPLSAALQASCPHGFTGMIPHYTVCTKFIHCVNGQEIQMDCPPGTMFDIKSNMCDYPYKSECASGQSEGQKRTDNQQQHSGYSSKFVVIKPYKRNVTYEFQSGINNQLGGFTGTDSEGRTYYINGGTTQQAEQSTHINDHLGGFSNSNQQGQWTSSSGRGGRQHGQTYQGQQTSQTGQSTHYLGGQNSQNGQSTYNLNAQGQFGQSSGQGYSGSNQNGQQWSSHHNTQGYWAGQNIQSASHHGSRYVMMVSEAEMHEMGFDGDICKNKVGVFEHPSNCSIFLYCENNRLYKGMCAEGTSYNPTKKICEYYNCHKNSSHQHGSSGEAKCPEGASGVYPHPTICEKFLNCDHGRTFIQDCGPGTVFNPAYKVCDFPYNVKCTTQSDRTGKLVTAASSQNSVSHNIEVSRFFGVDQDFCRSRDGFYQDMKNCSRFFNCRNGLLSMGICHPGSFYNPSTNNCDNDYKCHLNDASQFKCSADGMFPHPSDCSKYMQCTHGKFIVMACGPGTLFNPISTVCDFPRNVRCTGQNTGQWQGQNQHGHSGQHLNGQSQTGQGENQGSHHQHTGHNYQHQNTGHWQSQNQNGQSGYDQSQTGQEHNQGSYHRGTGHNSQNQNTGQWQGQNQNGHGGRGQSQTGQGHQQTWHNSQNQNTGHSQGQNQNGINPQFKCSADGMFPHPSDCTKYMQCANGKFIVMSCGPGTVFNPTTTVCDFPSNVRCGQTYATVESQASHHQQPGYNSQNTGQWNSQNQNGQSGQHLIGQSQTGQGQTQGSQQNGQNSQNQNTGHWQNQNQGSQHSGQWPGQNNHGQWPGHNNHGQGNYHHRPNTAAQTTSQQPWSQNQGRQTPSSSSNQDQQVQSHWTTNVDPEVGESNIDQNFVNVDQTSNWTSSIQKTDPNADYVFEYDDLVEVDAPYIEDSCDFKCSDRKCIKKSALCDGIVDCSNGEDEKNCEKYLRQFTLTKDNKMAVREKSKYPNTTLTLCAKQCLESDGFKCKAFNYRKHDGMCFILDKNVGQIGSLFTLPTYDYYEYKKFTMDCSNKFVCGNLKCLEQNQVCNGVFDCVDREDEKNCKPEKIGYEIQLVGAELSYAGAIQVSAFGKTGYVCDDQFGLRDAHVVCKELGFELGALEVKGNSYYSSETADNNTFYMMDDVNCFGNETSLKDCDFGGWGVHNCKPKEVVGVVCKTPQEVCSKDYWKCETGNDCIPLTFMCDGVHDCNDKSDEASQYCESAIEIRLSGGRREAEGRLEIKYHGTWGTICDDDFNDDAAKVVCRYLGFKGPAHVKKDGYYGPGKGPIWLDQVFCQGNETTIQECDHWDWGKHNCDHGEDVGIACDDYNVEGTPRHTKVQTTVTQLSANVFSGRCGYRNDDIFLENSDVHFRVVKGSLAERGQYPWQASIRVKGQTKHEHWCGAVVISEKFVLTAAHCLHNYKKGGFVVVAGDYDRINDEGTEQVANIDEFYLHEDFRKVTKMNNDIALVKLKGTGFNLTKDIQPICLPPANFAGEVGLNCTISGFGSIQSGKAVASQELRAGWVPVQPREVCKMPHIYGESITDGMLCAGSLDEGIDACDGDSGGPLACLKDGLFTLIGVISWGQHCGYANKPGVYVKIAHYRDWIDHTMNKHS